ncbi:MAG TPA: BadF/BadG/BcrA/BcrD ATPase family protein, partial [Deltaproteobacteria bacterium]|nr:BadF/BadG/BcrA/BcrD ATPase family protein [Deltaproteobacteria bacterium]
MEYLGIDVGSSYLKVWIEDEYQDPVASRCMHHKGSPKACILEELSHLGRVPEYLCYCGNLSGQAMKQWHYDGIIAEIDFLKGIYPQRYLLIFGAEKIELVHYDSTGRILSYQTNPTCAAGTGSFLDEQMKRLGLSLEGLDQIPIDEDAPLVASRCAVFAKTDLIHLQQEGHSAYAMYNGLCKGLVISGIKSMFGGNIPDGSDILLSGGLLINPHVRHFLNKMLPHSTPVSDPMFSRAKGLCEKARQNAFKTNGFVRSLKASGSSSSSGEDFMPLDLNKSTFPSVEISRRRDAFGNELWHDIRPGEFLDAYLGVDIGSTSTKAVLVDTADAIRLDLYTKTAGNPLEATRRIFSGIVSLQETLGFTCTIRGCSTTGSGRTLVGKVIGADCIINEISAHAKGAKTVDPGVKTIFEIGGQDAKFIRLDKGRIVDVNMNYVCAAGT